MMIEDYYLIEEELEHIDYDTFIDSYLKYSKFKKLRYGQNFKAINQFNRLVHIKVKIIPKRIRINKENTDIDMDCEKDPDEPDN